MMRLINTSSITGKKFSMFLPISEKRFSQCFDEWCQGKDIYSAFPELTADQVEFIRTGVPPHEFDVDLSVCVPA
jgi:hypothetical protein